jgi:hypothetical protein
MDNIKIEVLEDGKISIQTSEISEKNHINADDLLDMIENLLGGERKREKRENEFWKKRKVLKGGKIITA